jgi:hypothetical protein
VLLITNSIFPINYSITVATRHSKNAFLRQHYEAIWPKMIRRKVGLMMKK